MACHIARWEVEGAIEGDGEMREITADPIAALQDIPRRQIGPAGHVTILDVVMHPAADGLNARHPVLDVAEFPPSEIYQLVGVAIPARQRIPQQRDGEISRSPRNSGEEVVVIRLRGNRYDCVMPKTIGARRERHATNAVPVTVDEFLPGEVIA